MSFAVKGVPPEIMGIGPIEAIPAALKKAGLKQDDLDWIELNEAFAAQALAVIRTCKLDPSKVNPLGGAIATGHPLGATGAIKTATVVHALRREQAQIRHGHDVHRARHGRGGDFRGSLRPRHLMRRGEPYFARGSTGSTGARQRTPEAEPDLGRRELQAVTVA